VRKRLHYIRDCEKVCWRGCRLLLNVNIKVRKNLRKRLGLFRVRQTEGTGHLPKIHDLGSLLSYC
jgi:hypothetical protein